MALIELHPYIDEIHRQFEAAAEAGGEDARALAQRLVAPLDATIRVALLDALSAAAQEITCELAPGSVEVRLRGRDPEFVVTTPPETAGDEPEPVSHTPVGEGELTRINLRLPEPLKDRVDHAAAAEGLSTNAWLVRAAAAAVDRAGPARRRERNGPQSFTGWAR